MALPEVIEIVPLEKAVRAEITVPGSKSITNRALILAALAEGRTILRGALWSEDTQVMVAGLHALGFDVGVEADAAEACNRTITVSGLGGRIPNTGTPEQPLELFVGNAGTAARFLSALVCLGHGHYRLHGVERMHQRPQAALFGALRELGYRIDAVGDHLPAAIHGTGPRKGTCRVSIEESSQFASALLLCSRVGGWLVNAVGENAEESPYVVMTSQLVDAFPMSGGEFQIEPDASSGSYFWAAGQCRLESKKEFHSKGGRRHRMSMKCTLSLSIRNWPTSGCQIDEKFPEWFFRLEERTRRFGREGLGLSEAELDEIVRKTSDESLVEIVISRKGDLGDSIMTAIVIAPFLTAPARFTDLGRLRLQECERVVALRTELTRCGAKVIEEGDTLIVYPSKLHGAEIETYHDHRMAMCFAILGLKVPGIRIKNPACVKKTFPNFFQKLATPPPHGPGATIRDAATGRALATEELFAD